MSGTAGRAPPTLRRTRRAEALAGYAMIAVPIAIGIATFLTNYAPRSLAKPCGILVDLLAAVPSIVFGLWGIFVLAPVLLPVAQWLNDNLGWFFLFADGNVSLVSAQDVASRAVRSTVWRPINPKAGAFKGLGLWT